MSFIVHQNPRSVRVCQSVPRPFILRDLRAHGLCDPLDGIPCVKPTMPQVHEGFDSGLHRWETSRISLSQSQIQSTSLTQFFFGTKTASKNPLDEEELSGPNNPPDRSILQSCGLRHRRPQKLGLDMFVWKLYCKALSLGIIHKYPQHDSHVYIYRLI